MYYQNVRGLRTKTKDFKLSSTNCNYDVVALSETGLNSSFFDGELFAYQDFCLYRCDRSSLNSEHERFGGVLIAVRTDIPSERVVVPLTENVELVLVKMKFHNMNVYVCCLYIPSGSPILVYQQYTEALERVIDFIDINVEDKFYILGGFNMESVSWVPDPGEAGSNGFLDGGESESNVLLPHGIDSSANARVGFWISCFVMSQVMSRSVSLFLH